MERNKEEIAEGLCFLCKDGGHLRICDYKDCLKAYHPHCVGKDSTFLETDEPWTCGWHLCFSCNKLSKFQCYCCPSSVCRGCIKSAEFIIMKKTQGLCTNCLNLAILAEQDADVDASGSKVDFHDTETYEFLFKDYWEMVNDRERLSLVDLLAADTFLKSGTNRMSESDSEKILEEDLMSSDTGLPHIKGPNGKRGRSKTKGPRTRKRVFLGWGSQELISFLSSIGKDTTEPISQLDVSEIVKNYAIEHNLFDSKKKNRNNVVCDEKLRSLFRKKTVKLSKLYCLVEIHLVENTVSDDEISSSSKEDNPTVSKKRNSKVSSELDQLRRKVPEPPRSEYAALVETNIKSIYLRKSLILKFLHDPETFNTRVIGCFVRVKGDSPRRPYQLGQVEGVKEALEAYMIGQTSTNIVLRVSDMWKDIKISMLSDDDIEEEECEVLRQMAKKGIHKRLTIAEFEEKLNFVHEDVMNHWIDREIRRLQKLIERANEKGWRRELFQYIDQRELLRKPEQRVLLLKEIPGVIPDEEEAISVAITTTVHPNSENQGVILKEIPDAEEVINVAITTTAHPNSENQETEAPRCAKVNEIGINTDIIEISDDEVVASDKIDPKINYINLVDDDDDASDGGGSHRDQDHISSSLRPGPSSLRKIGDDIEVAARPIYPWEWHYADPIGEEQGPFPLDMMSKWYIKGIFDDHFKVWRMGQSRADAVLLKDVLNQMFP